MGLSGSNVLLKKPNCSRQLTASSAVLYQLIGVVTESPFGQSPDTSSNSDSPLKTK